MGIFKKKQVKNPNEDSVISNRISQILSKNGENDHPSPISATSKESSEKSKPGKSHSENVEKLELSEKYNTTMQHFAPKATPANGASRPLEVEHATAEDCESDAGENADALELTSNCFDENDNDEPSGDQTFFTIIDNEVEPEQNSFPVSPKDPIASCEKPMGHSRKESYQGWLPTPGIAQTISSPDKTIVASQSNDAPQSSSTTRLRSLPAKDPKEEAKHLKQFDEMMKIAKEKERKEELLRKKKFDKREKKMKQSLEEWEYHIIPKWNSKKTSKKTKELWFEGIPSRCRGKVWTLTIPNTLGINEDVFRDCISRGLKGLSKDLLPYRHHDSEGRQLVAEMISQLALLSKEETISMMHEDISKTFPGLGLFQNEGPYYSKLDEVLKAYVMFRPEVGYIRGMSNIAAMFLVNMDSANAFTCMSNMIEFPFLKAFYNRDMHMINRYLRVFGMLLAKYIPILSRRFQQVGVSPDLYFYDWIIPLFTKTLNFDTCTRVWDCYLLHGDIFLFQTSLAILQLLQKRLEVLSKKEILAELKNNAHQIDEETLFEQISHFMNVLTTKEYQQWLSRCL